MWVFMNWRSLPTLQKAAFDCGSQIESLLVWDKDWIGPGGPRGLRPSYELVALMVEGDYCLVDRGIPDIKTCPWSSQKPNGHPAEKPEELMEWLVKISNPDTVLDPFMGSGTTLVACQRLGRKGIGIEIDEHYYEIALKRVQKEVDQGQLFTATGSVVQQQTLDLSLSPRGNGKNGKASSNSQAHETPNSGREQCDGR